ncbi:hypothetical protein ACX9MO_13635 [Pseudooceanicola sp. 502str34]
MTIPAGPYDTVHVFAADLDDGAFWDFLQPEPETGRWELPAALGAPALEASHVDGTDVADLDGIGLSAFLIEGQGVDPAALAPDRARVDALTGHVIILRPGALPEGTETLDPRPPLRHVGSYALPEAPVTIEPLTAVMAEGDMGPPPPSEFPAEAPRFPRSYGWILAILVLIVLLVGVFL